MRVEPALSLHGSSTREKPPLARDLNIPTSGIVSIHAGPLEMNTVKRRSISFLAPLLGGFALLYSSSAFAGPATDLVKDKQSAIFQILQSDSPDEKKIGSIFDEMLDYS